MRVLFLDHPEADFLAGVLFLGLHQELGADNVVDYPPKLSYHGQVHSYPSFYDRHDGSGPWHGHSTAPDGSVMGHTAPFAWMPPLEGRGWSRDEVVQALVDRRFDLVVMASPRKISMASVHDLVRTIGAATFPPLVFVDGEDYTDMRWDVVDAVRGYGVTPKVYFKRELLSGGGVQSGARVEPCPFASAIPVRPPVEKTIDVSFLGGRTWSGRDAACAALKSALGDRFFGGTGGTLSFDDYLDVIARSRISVSIRGFGHDTLRFWEIPSFDTLMVCDVLPIIKPHPFDDGQNLLYFRSSEELVSVVTRALGDRDWQRRIALAGNEHLRRYHTARARAQQILRIATS